jgi:2,4-dienoyl-CoA reductase (NADPH2)
VNPKACFETEWEKKIALKKGVQPKNVAVVGGGPAGLAAAQMAAELGHKVTLFESNPRLGGQFLMACQIPGKEDYAHTVRYFETVLPALNVNIQTSKRVDPSDLKKFEHVIVATGVVPRTPHLPGLHLPIVKSYVEVLKGTAQVGKRVVIMGAGGIGFDVAEFLAHRESTQNFPPLILQKTPSGKGNHLLTKERQSYLNQWGVDVGFAERGSLKSENPVWTSLRNITVLQRKPGKPGERLGKTTGWIHKASLKNFGVEMLSGVTYEGVTEDGLRIVHQGEQKFLPADTIVVCAGQESETSLVEALKGHSVSFSLVGGARFAGELDAKRAFVEGMEAALEIG